MVRKHVSQVTLTTGEKIIVSLERGVAARNAMAQAPKGAIWVIPEQNDRAVKATLIGDVKDVWVEDIQLQLGEQLKEAKRIAASGQKVEPTATSTGYIKFLLAERKNRRIQHKRNRQDGPVKLRPLTDEQLAIILPLEEKEKQKEKTLNEIGNIWTNALAEE